MMVPMWWIREIDWRVSSGVIFFIQLLVWRCKEKRGSYPVRIFASAIALCGGSWCMRYILEVCLLSRLTVAFGYSIYIMVLSLLFIACYRLLYQTSADMVIFFGIVALTVYRMSWNAVKLISALPIGTDAAWTAGSPFQSVMSYMLYLVLSVGCSRMYRRFVRQTVSFPVKMVSMLFAITLLCQMMLEFTYQFLYNDTGGILFFMTALLYCAINFGSLITRAILNLSEQEKLSMENFIRSKQQYYEISREGILSLQIKCHDLKHQIALIRSAEGQRQLEQYIKSLSDSIDEYNTVIDSGNKGIDVVLTEKNIICSTNGVRFTYIIDGTLFSFLTDMEIYALFGNAMDNALESMEDTVCAEKKFISLKAARNGNMVVLVIENYFEHEPKFRNGMPATTKAEERHHGFGLRSIMAIAQNHGGNACVQAEDHIFRLTVSMRVSE